MSVSIEVDVCAHLKYHADLGVQRDSLLPRDLEVLHKVDYRVPVRRPRILGESDALMRPIGDVRPSDLLKKVDLSHDRLIVEFLVERMNTDPACLGEGPNLMPSQAIGYHLGTHPLPTSSLLWRVNTGHPKE